MKKTVTFQEDDETFFVPEHDESRDGMEWMLAALDRKRARREKKKKKKEKQKDNI